MWSSSWVVGVDLTQKSHGALEFAKWLRSHFMGDALEEFAVHIVEPRGLLGRLGWSVGGENNTTRAWRKLQALASAHHAEFDDFESIPAASAAEELPHAASRRGASGLIVGRHAPSEGWSLVALGSTTRRLVEAPEMPVVVVPSDLDAAAIGDGPVLVVVDPEHGSDAALRYGDRLAMLLGRPLLAVHVVDPADPSEGPEDTSRAAATASAAPWPHLDPRRSRREGVDRLIRMMRGAGVWPRPLRVAMGGTQEQVRLIAEEEDACMVVCSPAEPRVERMFSPAPSFDLAAHGRTPVCVVPPGFEAAALV